MSHQLKRSLTLAGGIALLSALLVHSILTNPDWRSFDFGVFLASFARLDWGWILLALLLVYSTYLIRALRWQILIRPIKPDAQLSNLLSATVIGFGAIAVMGRPGEFVRPYLVARKENVPVSGQLAVWVLERSFDSLLLLASVAFAVGQFQPSAGSQLSGQWWNSLGHVVGVSAVAILGLLIFLRGYFVPISARLLKLLQAVPLPFLQARLGALSRFCAVFADGLRSLRDWRAVALCLLWSALQWALIAGSYYAVLIACSSGLSFDLSQAIIFMGIAMAGSMFQIPGVGGGMQIACVLALTEVLGMKVEVASSTAILVWFLTFLAIIPPALVLLVHDGLTWGKLRELESEA